MGPASLRKRHKRTTGVRAAASTDVHGPLRRRESDTGWRRVSVRAHRVVRMSTVSLPGGAPCRALADLNTQIRNLMMQRPATDDRAEEYTRLLAQWADLTQAEVTTAA